MQQGFLQRVFYMQFFNVAAMSKSAKYHENAETCRELARAHSRCTENFLQMAAVWDLLAAEHENEEHKAAENR